MDDMEQKLQSILGNPEMMSQLMSMAQSLGANQEADNTNVTPPPHAESPGLDIGMLQKMAGFAGKTGIDQNQRALLKALQPYLNGNRVAKLEKAMRASKIASLATTFLGNSSIFG